MLRRKEEEETKFLDVNATMQGNLVFSDPVNLRINGKFEGNLSSKGNLVIGESAEVKAEINGEVITIYGRVVGTIKATKLISLMKSAEVYVDIETPRLSIEEGAIFNGKCKMFPAKMTLEELSHYLSVEENKILEWVNNGKIPTEREGDKLFFDYKKVEAWITQKK